MIISPAKSPCVNESREWERELNLYDAIPFWESAIASDSSSPLMLEFAVALEGSDRRIDNATEQSKISLAPGSKTKTGALMLWEGETECQEPGGKLPGAEDIFLLTFFSIDVKSAGVDEPLSYGRSQDCAPRTEKTR